MNALRRQYETFKEHLEAVEDEHESMQDKIDETEELRRTILHQAAEIMKLNDILQENIATIDILRAAEAARAEEVQEFETDAAESTRLKQTIETHKAEHEAEVKLREQAEKRLNEYLEALKKVAAIQSAIEG
jgi:predicted RNase H-like nuclease (RuvC/YqgF family)